MYSNEEKLKAINTYIKNGLRTAPTIRELGYPDRKLVKKWYNNYMDNGKTFPPNKRKPKYTKEQRENVIQHYLNTGRCISYSCKTMGYPSRRILKDWLKEDLDDFKIHCLSGKAFKPVDNDVKLSILTDVVSANDTIANISKKHDISPVTVHNIRNKSLSKESLDLMNKNRKLQNKNTKEYEDEVTRLKKEVAKLQIEKDILEEAIKIIKKDIGINIHNLSNKQKSMIINALKYKYSINILLSIMNLSSSNYFYHAEKFKQGDKYIELRAKIKEIFVNNYNAYGYRRIKKELEKLDIIVSEKVIRRLMKEEGLVIPYIKKKKYSSYIGEISPSVPNLVNQDFHSDTPNTLLLTDLTELAIPAGKVYLSPLVDCYDGLVLSWTIGVRPNAELVNSMLKNAIPTLKDSSEVIIHSDRGCHYRWPEWINIMDDNNITRSMSKKGCSPDNAACEGFFGRLKNEMFYKRDWKGYSLEEFIKQIDDYIIWYNEKRIKESLGWLSPIEYRIEKGLI